MNRNILLVVTKSGSGSMQNLGMRPKCSEKVIKIIQLYELALPATAFSQIQNLVNWYSCWLSFNLAVALGVSFIINVFVVSVFAQVCMSSTVFCLIPLLPLVCSPSKQLKWINVNWNWLRWCHCVSIIICSAHWDVIKHSGAPVT